MSNKFDLVYEKALNLIKEEAGETSDLEYNIKTLVLKLQDPINGYIGRDATADAVVKRVLANRNTLDVGSDGKNFLPKIRLQFSQTPGVEDFNVEARVLANNSGITEKSKKWAGNESPESICDGVVAYLDKVSLEAAGSDSAVKTMAPEKGANAQPGAEQSALPTGQTQQQPPQEEQQPTPSI